MVDDPTAPLKVEITGHEVSNKKVEYNIQCTQSDRTWSFKRRYRDFAQLNAELAPFGLELNLPPKKVFGNLDASFIAERKLKLQEFLRRVACHPFLFCSPMAAQFLELSSECLKNYENYVLFSARNNPTYRLKRLWHASGWRFYKLHAELAETSPCGVHDFVLTWTSFGPDAFVHPATQQARAQLCNDAFKFLRDLPPNYFYPNLHAAAGEKGIYVLNRKLDHGSIRDMTYATSSNDSFLRKYSMLKECKAMFCPAEIVYITRQLLEVTQLLDVLEYPMYDLHCNNIVVDGEAVSLLDYEFALAGHSNADRECLLRSKARTVPDMRIFYLGVTVYELLTGNITVPVPDEMDDFYEKCPREFRQLLALILGPGEQMPSAGQLLSLPVFRNCPPVPLLDGQRFLIPKHVQQHFQQLSRTIERRFAQDKDKVCGLRFGTNVFQLRQCEEKARLEQHLESDAEKRRRRNIIQDHLRTLENKQ